MVQVNASVKSPRWSPHITTVFGRKATQAQCTPFFFLLCVLIAMVFWMIAFQQDNVQQQHYSASATTDLLSKSHNNKNNKNNVASGQQEFLFSYASSSSLPIRPSLLKHENTAAINAIQGVFDYGKHAGGWINVNELKFQDIAGLRQLGRTIMSRNTSCGRPKIQDQEISAGLEYCFWPDDIVSLAAIENFGFERDLWSWIIKEFQALNKDIDRYYSSDSNTSTASKVLLGILDIGVNVGDWASPLRFALPDTPYFGIEGTPSTGAIATANMRTSVEHHLRAGRAVAPTVLLPYALVSAKMVNSVREAGGVCFEQVSWNVGGQGVNSVGSKSCSPSVTAGGTLLPHALHAVASLQDRSDWPRVYMTKIDVEGFEFKALVSAMDWLIQRPPCYIMIEFHLVPQNPAIMELLLDLGYDSLWRSINSFSSDISPWHSEFPPGPPYWSRSQNQTITLHKAVEVDLSTITGYKDYLFGFENKEKCIRHLLE